MARGRKKGYKVPKPEKIEDIETGKRYVWILKKFSDSRVYKIPVEMIVELGMKKMGRERDVALKDEMMSSKTLIKDVADTLSWGDVKDRAYLYDGQSHNAFANYDKEWKEAKTWIEEDLKVRYV